MTAREIAEKGLILRCSAGSELYGTNVRGIRESDRDELGLCLEPPEYVVGLKSFEQWVYRDAEEGERSGAGDLDLTVWSARKWAKLALNGNPTALQLLFVPREQCSALTDAGAELQDLAWAFASKKAGAAFLGYMSAQLQRLKGERGQLRVKRPELEEEFGYDTKYAAHIVRLGYQGIEFLTTGQITLPMPDEERDYVIKVRTGLVSYDEVLTWAGILEHELKALRDTSPLPDEPDRGAVDDWLIRAHVNYWQIEPYSTWDEYPDD